MPFFRRIFILLLIIVGAWGAGALWFGAQIVRISPQELPQADAIVALTGSAGRIEYAFTLFLQGKAPRLFISGTAKGARLNDVLGTLPREMQTQITDAQRAYIDLGDKATSTLQNAQELADWVADHSVKRVLLVTSDYHMPRSILECSRTVPHVELIAAPFASSEVHLPNWWADAPSRNRVLSEYHKTIGSLVWHTWLKPEKNE